MQQAERVDLRRRQLLEVAIRLFGRKGYHLTTMRDIANAAEVSVGMIYQYFADKEDLLSSAIMEILESYAREIPRAIATADTADTRFHAAILAYARVIDRNRDAASLGYRTSWALRKDRLAVIFRKEQETTAIIRERVDECIRTGVFQKVDAEILTYQLIALVHAWALSAWRLPQPISVEDYVERNLKVLLGPIYPAKEAAGLS
jgi:AcrR family transcriptional regulator